MSEAQFQFQLLIISEFFHCPTLKVFDSLYTRSISSSSSRRVLRLESRKKHCLFFVFELRICTQQQIYVQSLFIAIHTSNAEVLLAFSATRLGERVYRPVIDAKIKTSRRELIEIYDAVSASALERCYITHKRASSTRLGHLCFVVSLCFFIFAD